GLKRQGTRCPRAPREKPSSARIAEADLREVLSETRMRQVSRLAVPRSGGSAARISVRARRIMLTSSGPWAPVWATMISRKKARPMRVPRAERSGVRRRSAEVLEARSIEGLLLREPTAAIARLAATQNVVREAHSP